MERHRERAEAALERALPALDTEPKRLHEAMRYAVLNGGKRVRPALVYATAEALGATGPAVDAPACAVEFIHAYSLAHDDLPCMDDDDLRRGNPTCHRRFDEATALLAGDALQSLAFEILSGTEIPSADDTRVSQMIRTLAAASGPSGMAGGQAIDLAAVGQKLSIEQLERMHRRKTGALIRASVRLGALTAVTAQDPCLSSLDTYAANIGLAFQIQDDILDEEGDVQDIGKTPGADRERNKPTYPSLLGLEAAKKRALKLHQDAIASLSKLDAKANTLRELSEYIVNRSQ